jgi:hypothetical protein
MSGIGVCPQQGVDGFDLSQAMIAALCHLALQLIQGCLHQALEMRSSFGSVLVLYESNLRRRRMELSRAVTNAIMGHL